MRPRSRGASGDARIGGGSCSLYWPAHDLVPCPIRRGERVNAEFNWWLLIVGLVIGAALTWLVMAESTRRDADVTDAEQRGEALWIASVLTSTDRPTEGRRVEEILRLHREYLAAPPPDDPTDTAAPMAPDATVTPSQSAADSLEAGPGEPPVELTAPDAADRTEPSASEAPPPAAESRS